MYEESSMDKKQSSRSGQPPSKGFGAENKKNQDVTNKPWPRNNGRRREPAGISYSTKPEPSRKPLPQRYKDVLDKRPKPRGNYYSEDIDCGNEDARLTDIAEYGSGRKNKNVNHLIGFYYPPRQGTRGYDAGANHHHHISNSSQRWFQSLKHKYSKEQFLQANCQFVVNSYGNYEKYMKNPDALVNWDLIEQVHIQVSEFPSCPICLYPPVAAKITRCGHVYCWTCVLHYLSFSDNTWCNCPICFESVHKQDLKSVMVKPYSTFNVNDNITMRLMRRERESLQAIPVDEITRWNNIALLNVSESDLNTAYSKLLLADLSEINSIVNRERSELQKQFIEDDCSVKNFVEHALGLLASRERNNQENQSKKELNDNVRNIKDAKTLTNCVKGEKNNDSVTYKDLPSEIIKDNTPSKYFYFYQASDGQHTYLHPLNQKMLEHVYGTLEQCPAILTGTIVEKQTYSMTEVLRNKKKYLQHLPITCQYEITEIQLKPPIITQETLDFFKDDLDRRRKQRQKRAREERKHEKRVLEKENRMMGRYPTPPIHIESHSQFPDFSEASSQSFPSVTSTMGNSTSVSEQSPGSSTSDLTSITTDQADYSSIDGPSFATMLTKSKATKSNAWPTIKQASPSRPTKLMTVTTGNRADLAVKHQNIEEEDSDEYAPAPAFSQSFGDAIALALEQSAKQACNDDADVSTVESGKKKKKKQNRKLLFATSMTYTGK